MLLAVGLQARRAHRRRRAAHHMLDQLSRASAMRPASARSQFAIVSRGKAQTSPATQPTAPSGDDPATDGEVQGYLAG